MLFLCQRNRGKYCYIRAIKISITQHMSFSKYNFSKSPKKYYEKNVWPLINRPRAVLGASLISMIMLWWLPMSSALVKHAMVIADVIWSVEACYGDCEFYGDHQCHVICRNMLLWSPVPCHVLWQESTNARSWQWTV